MTTTTIENGTYILHRDGSDWVALYVRDGSIAASCPKAIPWTGFAPSESDRVLTPDEAEPIISLYDSFFRRSTNRDTSTVTRSKFRVAVTAAIANYLIESTAHGVDLCQNQGGQWITIRHNISERTAARCGFSLHSPSVRAVFDDAAATV